MDNILPIDERHLGKIHHGGENVSVNTKLNRYFGKLSPAQVAEGMNCANSNAKRLLRDAELLCQNGRYPSAVGLAILAVEEAGKEAMLRTLVLARNADELKASWKDYRTHTMKNRLLAMPSLISSGARELEDFSQLFGESEYPHQIENLKQLCFYSDCLDAGRWSSPAEVINEKQARQVVASAKVMIDNKFHVTEKEVELWIKHLGPVWKKDMGQMKAALKNWFVDMVHLGLLKGNIGEVEGFVDGKKRWVH
jgi:AbiV family abortive infection protein